MAPTHFNLQTINAGGQKMADGINNIVKLFRFASMFDVGQYFGIFMNIIIEVQRMLIGVGDLSGNSGFSSNFTLLIQNNILANSTWSGLGYGAVRTLFLQIQIKHYGNYKN